MRHCTTHIRRCDLARIAGALALLASAAGCSGPVAPAIARVRAEEGGSVAGSTHRVVIPARALAADTEVSLETASASSYPALAGAREEVLRIEPEGTVLELPAEATIRADFIDLPAGARVSVAQLATGDGVSTWMPLESTRDASSGDVTVEITRFAPLAVVVSEETASGTGIRGRITWGEGSPAAGAPVQLFEGSTMLTTATADADGAFAFTDLASGSYRLVVDYECRLDVAVEVRAGAVTERDLVLCGGS